MPGPANSLNISQPGIVVFDGVSNFLGRTLTAGSGISITNGTGISANPVITATGGGGGSTVYFQAYLSTTTNYATGSTSNVAIFDNAVTNVGGGYNAATGIFTAPATGFYAFESTCFFVTGVGTTQFIVAVTGSVQSFRAAQLDILSAITSVAWSMGMTAGDTIKIVPYADGTGNFQLNGAAVSSATFNTPSIFSGFKVA